MKRKRSGLSSWIGSCLSPLFRLVSETVGEAIKSEFRAHLALPPPAAPLDRKESVPHKRRKVETRTNTALETEVTVTDTALSLTDQHSGSAEKQASDSHSDHILYHELHADEFDPLG